MDVWREVNVSCVELYFIFELRQRSRVTNIHYAVS